MLLLLFLVATTATAGAARIAMTRSLLGPLLQLKDEVSKVLVLVNIIL